MVDSQNYNSAQLEFLYSLGRFYLEAGQLHAALNIYDGLVEVAPDYQHAWYGKVITETLQGSITNATKSLETLSELAPDQIITKLIAASVSLCQKKLSSAGSLLGEVKEIIDSEQITNPHYLTYYKLQLAHFDSLNKQEKN